MNELINEILKHRHDKGVGLMVQRDYYAIKHHINNNKRPQYLLNINIKLDKDTYNKLFSIVNNLNGGDKNGSNE